MKISNLRLEEYKDEARLVADIESICFGNDIIWVSVPKENRDYLTTDRYDGFLLALLFPAMAYKEDIEVVGKLSKRLLRNINSFVQDILLAYDINILHRISIKALDTTNEVIPTATHVGTGFSGGIDSFSTIYDNYVLEKDPDYRVDSLVCLNVGSHGEYNGETGNIKTEQLFNNRFQFLRKYTDTIGLPFIPVNSNIHRYLPWGHLHTEIISLVAGILAIQKKLRRYYVASVGWNYNQWVNNTSKSRSISLAEFSEPYLLPLLSTETIEFILDGIQYSRVQKTINIANYPETKQFLNVCLVNEPQKKNCGTCPKCKRVGLTLSVINKLDDYKNVFNIENFRRNEFRLKCEAVFKYKSDPFMSDIVDFSKLHGKIYPPYIVSAIYMTFNRNSLKMALRSVLPKKLLDLIKNRYPLKTSFASPCLFVGIFQAFSESM